MGSPRAHLGIVIAGLVLATLALAGSALAATASVAISDFRFTPAQVTVHVGDTVTWTNDGPSAHTTTADNGMWDSGILNVGQSFSFTFRSAGTFAYHCRLHPLMTGTIVVLPAAMSTAPSAPRAPAAGNLPNTSTAPPSAGPAAGIALVALGFAGVSIHLLRRRVRR